MRRGAWQRAGGAGHPTQGPTFLTVVGRNTVRTCRAPHRAQDTEEQTLPTCPGGLGKLF